MILDFLKKYREYMFLLCGLDCMLVAAKGLVSESLVYMRIFILFFAFCFFIYFIIVRDDSPMGFKGESSIVLFLAVCMVSTVLAVIRNDWTSLKVTAAIWGTLTAEFHFILKYDVTGESFRPDE